MEGCCGCESSNQMHHIEREGGKGHRIGVRLVSQIDDLRSSVAGQAVDAARREMRPDSRNGEAKRGGQPSQGQKQRQKRREMEKATMDGN